MPKRRRSAGTPSRSSIAHREPRLGQAEQGFERVDQRIEAATAAVGQAEGDVPRVVRRQQANTALDMRRVGIDVGHHHDDVAQGAGRRRR